MNLGPILHAILDEYVWPISHSSVLPSSSTKESVSVPRCLRSRVQAWTE